MGEARNIRIFDSKEKAYDFIIDVWTQKARIAIEQRGRFAVALSGGKTPVGFFNGLSQTKDLPWEKTHIFQVDERFVPWNDDENNSRLIKQCLIDRIAIPPENIHFIPTEEITMDEASKLYERELQIFFGDHDTIPRFDLIMLGISDDGHTASLFTGFDPQCEAGRLAIPVVTGRVPHQRITLTLNVINSARRVIFLVTGKHKALTIQKIIEKKDYGLPASHIELENGVLFYVLDREAASMLRSSQQQDDGEICRKSPHTNACCFLWKISCCSSDS